MKHTFGLFLFLLFVSLCNAQRIDYSYAIPLKNKDLAWQRIPLPLSVFDHTSTNLDDVRLYGRTANGDTIEVPYVLKIEEDKERIVERTCKILNQSDRGDAHFYTFTSDKSEPINQIFLNFEEQNFDWRIQLEGGNDGNNWFTVLEDYRIFSFDNAQEQYSFSTLDFPNTQYKYYRIQVQATKKPKLQTVKLNYLERTAGQYVQQTLIKPAFINDAKLKTQSLKIATETTYPISKIHFYVASTFDYFRRIQINSAFTISKPNSSVKINKGEISLFSGYLSSLEENEFSCPTAKVSNVNFSVYNQDNPPLQFDSIVILSAKQYLVANLTEKADYFLAFGDPDANAPQYDIQHFTDKIPALQNETPLGDLVENSQKLANQSSPLFENKAWLWALMGLIILVLGWFSMQMLRK